MPKNIETPRENLGAYPGIQSSPPGGGGTCLTGSAKEGDAELSRQGLHPGLMMRETESEVIRFLRYVFTGCVLTCPFAYWAHQPWLPLRIAYCVLRMSGCREGRCVLRIAYWQPNRAAVRAAAYCVLRIVCAHSLASEMRCVLCIAYCVLRIAYCVCTVV